VAGSLALIAVLSNGSAAQEPAAALVPLKHPSLKTVRHLLVFLNVP
jgi:hypothetical protein